jgi:hypothetical protein
MLKYIEIMKYFNVFLFISIYINFITLQIVYRSIIIDNANLIIVASAFPKNAFKQIPTI